MRYNYNFAKTLFEDYRWKKPFMFRTQECFKKHFEKKGQWGQNVTDPNKFGIIINGLWHWMNRINTHPNCLVLMIKWCLEKDENFFTDLGNPLYHKKNINLLWDYMDENFELFFTNNIEEKYYEELKYKCNKSWGIGNISNIAIIMSLKKVFLGSYDYDYTFNYGDGSDMNGVDVSFITADGELKKIQTKSGKYMNMGSEFYVNGSQNTLDYNVDYYSYCNVDSYYSQTSVIIFKNDVGLCRDEQNDIEIPKKLVLYHKIENMPIPEMIHKIYESTLKLKREFTLTKEGENNVIINENQVIINIPNLDDPNLENILDEKLKELQQLLN
jgi:hypothetical protein